MAVRIVLQVTQTKVFIAYHPNQTTRHEWEDCRLFKKCQHSPLCYEDSIQKPWLKLGSPAYCIIENVVTNKHLVSDLKYLTNFNHTGTLEVYHSLYNKFCPKRLHFPYLSMIARSQIAVLDFNAGIECNEYPGKQRYKQQFSKVTQTWVLKKISQKKKRVYIDALIQEVLHLKHTQEEYPLPIVEVPKNIALVEKPSKVEALKNLHTRFL